MSRLFRILALEPKDAKFGWVTLLHACGQRFCRVTVDSWEFRSLLVKKMDEFHGFPAFPLFLWHKRFALFQISCLQVDLEKKKISILLMSFDCK